MKEPKDKRTKEYKDWKEHFENNKPKGVGDIVENITKATGIKKLVHAIAGEDCGCEERKQYLNKIFRKNNIECFTQEEYDYLSKVFATQTKITPETQMRLKAIYERVFNVKVLSSCLSCSFIKSIYNPLKNVYNA